jgi:hypothetical protein
MVTRDAKPGDDIVFKHCKNGHSSDFLERREREGERGERDRRKREERKEREERERREREERRERGEREDRELLLPMRSEQVQHLPSMRMQHFAHPECPFFSAS